MKSKLYRDEVLPNMDRRFGADGIYYPAIIRGNNGDVRALFTQEQIQAAIVRAAANHEDWPK